MAKKPQAFTLRYPQAVNRITNAVGVLHSGHGINIESPPDGAEVTVKGFNAIWDTGATHTTVVPSVVKDCGLKRHGSRESRGIENTPISRPTYMADLFLPMGVVLPNIEVACLETDDQLGGAHILIGMDIIGAGDFSITLEDGKTVFSFRVPHKPRPTDYVNEINRVPSKKAQGPKAPIVRGPRRKKSKGQRRGGGKER